MTAADHIATVARAITARRYKAMSQPLPEALTVEMDARAAYVATLKAIRNEHADADSWGVIWRESIDALIAEAEDRRREDKP
jgi:hypothetical protein